MSTLRVGTLNLWHDELDVMQRLEAAAKWVQDSAIDVLCVQEACEHDGRPTSEVLADLAGMAVATQTRRGDDVVATGVLLTESINALVGGSGLLNIGGQSPLAAWCSIEGATRRLPVMSAHLCWGGAHEHTRLKQARKIVKFFDDALDGSDLFQPAILCGDLNTEPDSDTVRYLTGSLAATPGTYWTDAWLRNDGGAGATTTPKNPYARYTALSYTVDKAPVLDPMMLPDRRIDYVLIRGWRHGRVFSPSNTSVVQEPLMSDHYAVVTELLID
jgi:endonuclease/exonuclease/phosphatase family metal-dependent hydrolase